MIETDMSNGFRINPIPQQAGTQTMQQAIYQAHNSPCGQNKLIYDPILVIGDQTFYFLDLKDLLYDIMNADSTVELLQAAIESGTTYLVDPSPTNRLTYLSSLLDWAKTLYAQISDKTPIPDAGYQYVLTVYDYNGNTIWDSGTPTLTPTTNTVPPQYVQVPLFTPNPLPGTPSPTSVNIYGISNYPTAMAWIDGATVNGALAQRSAYTINQAAMPESVMAIASLLTDPANTRVYGFPRYGFSSRQNTLNAISSDINYGQLGFYCCYLNSLYSNPIAENNYTSTLIEYIFVRIGLAQSAAPP